MTTLSHGDNDVLWLEVSIYNIVIMQKLKGKQNFCNIIRHVLLNLTIKESDLAKQGASFYVFQLKVEVLLVLERAEYSHKKWTLWHKDVSRVMLVSNFIKEHFIFVNKELKNFSLRDDVVNLLHLSHAFFL